MILNNVRTYSTKVQKLDFWVLENFRSALAAFCIAGPRTDPTFTGYSQIHKVQSHRSYIEISYGYIPLHDWESDIAINFVAVVGVIYACSTPIVTH